MSRTDELQKEYDNIHENFLRVFDQLDKLSPTKFRKNVISNHLQVQRSVDEAISKHNNVENDYTYTHIDKSRAEQARIKFNQKLGNYRRKGKGYYERVLSLDDLYAVCKVSGLTPNQVIWDTKGIVLPESFFSVDDLGQALVYIKLSSGTKDNVIKIFDCIGDLGKDNVQLPSNMEFKIRFIFELFKCIKTRHVYVNQYNAKKEYLNSRIEFFRHGMLVLSDIKEKEDVLYELYECIKERSIRNGGNEKKVITEEEEREYFFCYDLFLDDKFFSWNCILGNNESLKTNNPLLKTNNETNEQEFCKLIRKTYISSAMSAAIYTIYNIHRDYDIEIDEYLEDNSDICQFLLELCEASLIRKNQYTVYNCAGNQLTDNENDEYFDNSEEIKPGEDASVDLLIAKGRQTSSNSMR